MRITSLFRWDKYPANVFWFALPLAFIGFGSLLLLAIIKWYANNDLWYAVIYGVGMLLLVFAMIPAWRIYRSQSR